MRRADRLFQIIQILRTRRTVITASRLAEELEVSERTVYRDISDLIVSGVPIEGEAGVGYVLRRGFDLPPLMFTREEIEALVIGIRLVSSWTDTQLARAARQALSKVEAVLPPALHTKLTNTHLYAPDIFIPTAMARAMAPIRVAIEHSRKLHFDYAREDGLHSERTVCPLALFYWGSAWTLGAWCELRTDFRNFRLDRIGALNLLDDNFGPEPGRTLEDFYRRMSEQTHEYPRPA